MEDSDKKFAELEQRWGVGRVLDFDDGEGGVIYFHVPTQADHERFFDRSMSEAQKAVTEREYVLNSIAEEQKEARPRYAALFERYSGMPDEIAKHLSRATIGGLKRREKKSESCTTEPKRI